MRKGAGESREGGSSVTARLWRSRGLMAGLANVRWWRTIEPDSSGKSGRRRWQRWRFAIDAETQIDADPGGWQRKFSRRGGRRELELRRGVGRGFGKMERGESGEQFGNRQGGVLARRGDYGRLEE